MSAQHRLIAFTNQFTPGVQSTGGQFSFDMPSLGFVPQKWIVRQILYDGATVLAFPVVLSCRQLGGVLGSFMTANSQAAAAGPVNGYMPGSYITNPNPGQDIVGSMDFILHRNNAPVTQLDGVLTVVMEFISASPPRQPRS